MDPISLFLMGLGAAALTNVFYQIAKAEEQKRERRAAIVTNIVISLGTGLLLMAVGYFAFGMK